MPYQLTDRAKQDLIDITEYTLPRFGKEQARLYLAKLRSTMRSLSTQPDMGRPRPELATNLCSHPCQSHTIYYLVDHSMLTVVRVLHQRMEPERRI